MGKHGRHGTDLSIALVGVSVWGSLVSESVWCRSGCGRLVALPWWFWHRVVVVEGEEMGDGPGRARHTMEYGLTVQSSERRAATGHWTGQGSEWKGWITGGWMNEGMGCGAGQVVVPILRHVLGVRVCVCVSHGRVASSVGCRMYRFEVPRRPQDVVPWRHTRLKSRWEGGRPAWYDWTAEYNEEKRKKTHKKKKKLLG